MADDRESEYPAAVRMWIAGFEFVKSDLVIRLGCGITLKPPRAERDGDPPDFQHP